jgi:rhodanese-related sulfurtransferase
LLGYTNVKIYDGSMEAWVKDNAIVAYTWTS